jgi:hypothetical protein
MCYDWEDKDASAATGEAEQKFGDHFSDAATLAEAEAETIKYIRGTLGRQKHKFDEGRVVIHKIWDVSDYAKRKNRFGKHMKVDDIIRPVIGGHVQADVHRIDHETLIIRVNKELNKGNQALPTAGLSAWQARAAEDVLAQIAFGKRTIAAELCARFGKTIFSGVLTRETEQQLTVIVSYVLTSFTSFEKDLSSFSQFKDLVVVDTAVDGYQDTIDAALASGRQVVAFLSMCMGEKRQKKINYLFSRDCKRLVLVDEADFGVHKSGQSKPLITARDPDDVVILMTGTNADKAVSTWAIDHMMSTVYPELLMEKRAPLKKYVTSLKYFQIDPTRHDLVVDIEFYQMNLTSAVEFARTVDPAAFVDDGVFLPSWSKFAANPIKAKGFWTRTLQAVFLGQHGLDALNVEYQTGQVATHRVAMMFLSGSIRNENLLVAAQLAQQAIPGYIVVPIYGDEMTNRTAEGDVKEIIEKAAKTNQSVLLLSAGMAQRSFSVPQITELYLAYDSGDNGATVQKMSRALTPDKVGKVGRIISLSFDPNRDDKFDAMLIETALNYKKTHKIASAKDAMRDVIRTVDIFRCTEDGAVKIEIDEYLEAAISRKSVSRVVGKTANIVDLDIDILNAIASGNAEVFRAAKVAAAEKGKTRIGVKGIGKGKGTPNDTMTRAKLLARAREVITTIVENLDIIVFGTNTRILTEAFEIVSENKEMKQAVKENFGLEFDLIVELFDSGIINQDLVELQVDN